MSQTNVTWSDDVHAADWIAERLWGSQPLVGAVIPAGFPAYARLLHPARATDGSPVRWSSLASLAGVSLRPTVQFEALVRAIETPGGGRSWDGEPPVQGSLPSQQVLTLMEVLTGFTTTPEQCWFGLWDGYGWLYGGAATRPLARAQAQAAYPAVASGVGSAPRVHLPNRDYLLYAGPLGAAAAFATTLWQQTPNLWWPADRAWCIASEIDLTSTYIGGAQALVDHLLADARFEAVPAQLTDTIAADGPG